MLGFIKPTIGLFFLSAILSSSVFAAELPVIPEATGFGITTPAGRGGQVHRVTNLNESGSGSLKNCIESNGPRICIFETSGTIRLVRNLAIKEPYLTIAGQTAPSPGITIRGAGIEIETNDVLIQHIRVRVGDENEGPGTDRDSIVIVANSKDVFNVVLDHVSASWSTDENFSTYANPGRIYDVTVRNSLFSEALNNSIHSKGEHSAGFMIGPGTRRVSVVNNVLAYNAWRNPLVRDDSTDVVIVNNLIYGTRGARTDQIDFGSRGPGNVPMRASVVGNNFIAPGSRRNTISISSESPSSFKLYQKDNSGPLVSDNAWSVVNTGGRRLADIEATDAPIWVDGLSVMRSTEVETYALSNSGARPADRDPVDTRVIQNIRNRRGGIIDSQSDVGGWPILAVNKRRLQIPDDTNGLAKSGYTNLEEWLHAYSRLVENGPLLNENNARSTLSGPIPESVKSSESFLGKKVIVNTGGARLGVRSEPDGSLLGRQPNGSTGTIIDGPSTAGGFTWWKVNYDNGIDGYSAGEFLNDTISSVNKQPENASEIKSGSRVGVNTGNGARLGVRITPGGTLLGRQPSGAQGIITDGPFALNGFIWWRVNYDSGIDGYSAGEYLLTYQN